MKDSSISYGRRAAAYWFADGLPDILSGMALVILGALVFWWRLYVPEDFGSRFDLLFLVAGFTFYFLDGAQDPRFPEIAA